MKKRTSSNSARHATAAPPMTVRLNSNSSVDFGQIVKQMEDGNMTPRDISDARNFVAAWLSRMRFEMGRLAAQRAKSVDHFRPNYRSLAETERAWEATELGQSEAELHHQIKALEGIFTALETNWFLLTHEAKGRM